MFRCASTWSSWWELSLVLTLSMIPWHHMAAARCQALHTLLDRHQLRCVFDPSSPEDLFLPSPRPGQNMCALVLRGVCKSWTSSHSPADFWLRYLCSDCFSLLHAAPGSSWDSRRALRKSPPNEFDCHAPSGRGSFRSCVIMYPTLAVHATPAVITV